MNSWRNIIFHAKRSAIAMRFLIQERRREIMFVMMDVFVMCVSRQGLHTSHHTVVAGKCIFLSKLFKATSVKVYQNVIVQGLVPLNNV